MPPLDPQAQQVLNQRNGAPQAPQPQQAQPRPQPQAQPQGAYPGVIRGAPRQPDPVTPVQQQNMANDAVRLDIAQSGEERAQRQAAMGNVSEQQAAFLAGRLGRGIQDIEYIFQQFPDTSQAPGLAETVLFNRLGPQSVIARSATDPQRRMVQDVQRDILDSILTLGTGAAYNKEQLDAMTVAYFPQFDDEPWMVEMKRRRLSGAFDDAITRAGPLAGDLQRYRDTFMGAASAPAAGGTTGPGAVPEGTPPPPPPGGPRPTLGDMFPQGADIAANTPDQPFDEMAYLRDTYGIEASQERQLVGMLNAASRGRTRGQFSANDVRMIYDQLNIPMPDEAGVQQLVEGVRSGNTYGGFDTSAAKAEYEQMLDARLRQSGDNPEGIGATIGAGASQGVTLTLADEAMGIGEGIAAAFRGENLFTGYQVGRDTDRRFNERSRQANPWTYGGSEFAGALTTGGVRVGSAAMRSTRPVAAAAREGAVLGGVTGFGSGEGPQQSLGGAAFGAGTGAILGTGLTVGAQKIAPGVNRIAEQFRGQRVTPAADDVRSVMDAGARRNVPIRRANVDPNVRGQRADLLQGDRGPALRAVEGDDLAALEAAVVRDLGSGASSDAYTTGRTVQTALNEARTRTRTRAGDLYTEVAQEAGQHAVEPTDALAALDRHVSELREAENANSALIDYLENVVRADLTRQGGLTVNALRAQRMGIAGRLKARGLDATDLQRRIGEVYDAAAIDLENALVDNPAAYSKLQEANRLWAEQAGVGERLGADLLGRGRGREKPPEDAARALIGYARDDYDRLSAVWGQIPEHARAEVRALLASQLGRGPQTGQFSAALFANAVGRAKGAKMTPQAVRLIFGEDGVRAVNDLRIIADSMTAAAERTNNSNTGNIVKRVGSGLRTMVAGSFGLQAAPEGMTAATAAAFAFADRVVQKLGEARTLRLLTNTDFTGWMRRLPETDNPRAIDASFERLRRVASGNAVFQSDVQAFQQSLLGAVNDNAMLAGNVAARPDEQE